MQSLEERSKILNTLTRILDGEPLTVMDFERFAYFMSIPLSISNPNEDEQQQIMYAIRQTVRQNWLGEKA